VEAYVLKNADKLGYNTKGKDLSKGCTLWQDKDAPVYKELQGFLDDVTGYAEKVKAFPGVGDVRTQMTTKDGQEDVCSSLELHPGGLKALFPSGQLSQTNTSGYIEPLLPPMRHPGFCSDPKKYLLNLDYIVHDFAAMCRSLKPTSRIVLIDAGASLDYHNNYDGQLSPAVYLVEMFRKFGMPFDHIYAYEVTPLKPSSVFQKVPKEWLPAYHWINVGIDTTPGGKLNPLSMVLDNFNEDDLIVFKLDIDTPSLEMPLAQQLLKDDRFNTMIDQFYFEHHVHLFEIYKNWWGRGQVEGSVKDTLELFSQLRQKGIPAHFWV
jgi:hypothetical protein